MKIRNCFMHAFDVEWALLFLPSVLIYREILCSRYHTRISARNKWANKSLNRNEKCFATQNCYVILSIRLLFQNMYCTRKNHLLDWNILLIIAIAKIKRYMWYEMKIWLKLIMFFANYFFRRINGKAIFTFQKQILLFLSHVD